MTRPIDVLRDLVWPTAATAPPTDQIERALGLVWTAMAAGIAALALLSLGQPGIAAGARTFTIAALAAIAASGAGALIGLLFGMPASAGRTVVAATPTTDAATTESAAATNSGGGDWYRDNTALERLSDWLTTAIVALTIANYNSIANRFDALAAGVTRAMFARGDAGMIPGGLVLGAYAILGFLGGYLWSRRYLRTILSAGVREARAIEREADAAAVARAEQANGVQAEPRSDAAAAQAAEVVEVVNSPAATESTGGGPALPEAIRPGQIADDPWKGQFGGQARRDGRVANATVAPLKTTPGLFAIELKIMSFDPLLRAKLAARPVRIYLHPSFPDFVRPLALDARGELALSLIAYGAFTVGIQFDDGATLELDLARLPDAPPAFRLG